MVGKRKVPGGGAAAATQKEKTEKKKEKEFREACRKGDLATFLSLLNDEQSNEDANEDEIKAKKIALLNCIDRASLWNCLHLATFSGHVSLIEWLMSDEGGRAAGFNGILARTKGNLFSVLHLASQQGGLRAVKAIVDNCKVENGELNELLNGLNSIGWSHLHWAALYNRTEIISWFLSSSSSSTISSLPLSDNNGGRALGFDQLLAQSTRDGATALHIAAREGNMDCFNALLNGCNRENGEKNALFSCVDMHGWTFFHVVTRVGRGATIASILEQHESDETVSLLHERDNEGMTALHRALIGGNDFESKIEWKRAVVRQFEVIDVAADLLGFARGGESGEFRLLPIAYRIDPNIGLKKMEKENTKPRRK